MKANWSIVAVAVTLMLAGLSWGVSIEYRILCTQSALDLNDRVRNLETLLTPLLIEYKVDKALREVTPRIPILHPPQPVENKARREAEVWAGNAIPRLEKGD